MVLCLFKAALPPPLPDKVTYMHVHTSQFSIHNSPSFFQSGLHNPFYPTNTPTQYIGRG